MSIKRGNKSISQIKFRHQSIFNSFIAFDNTFYGLFYDGDSNRLVGRYNYITGEIIDGIPVSEGAIFLNHNKKLGYYLVWDEVHPDTEEEGGFLIVYSRDGSIVNVRELTNEAPDYNSLYTGILEKPRMYCAIDEQNGRVAITQTTYSLEVGVWLGGVYIYNSDLSEVINTVRSTVQPKTAHSAVIAIPTGGFMLITSSKNETNDFSVQLVDKDGNTIHEYTNEHLGDYEDMGIGDSWSPGIQAYEEYVFLTFFSNNNDLSTVFKYGYDGSIEEVQTVNENISNSALSMWVSPVGEIYFSDAASAERKVMKNGEIETLVDFMPPCSGFIAPPILFKHPTENKLLYGGYPEYIREYNIDTGENKFIILEPGSFHASNMTISTDGYVSPYTE